MKKILAIMVCSVCCDFVAAQQAYTLEQIKDSALHNNIAIRHARHSIDAAKEQRKEAFTKYFPTVSVPISDWWGGSHTIKRRKIEHQKAVEQLEDNAQLLQIRMQNAWNGLEESYQQLLLAQRGIEQAKENLRLNRNYYKAGISKMSDLLEAQMLYQQSCDKQTDAFANYQNKLLEYRQATGM